MAANCTGKICMCYEDEMYYPYEGPPSSTLIIVALVHIYFVVILGTLCKCISIYCYLYSLLLQCVNARLTPTSQ